MIMVETGSTTVFVYDDVLDTESCDKIYDFILDKKRGLLGSSNDDTMPWHCDKCLEMKDLSGDLRIIAKNHRENVVKIVNNHYQSVFRQLFPEFSHIVLWDKKNKMNRHTDDETYSTRKVSCVTYLNDDFVGGETFIRTEHDKDYICKPKKGRLVIYLSNPINSHGVNQISDGYRVTFPMWFGTNQSNVEEMLTWQ
jgi:hypothetical protein